MLKRSLSPHFAMCITEHAPKPRDVHLHRNILFTMGLHIRESLKIYPIGFEKFGEEREQV